MHKILVIDDDLDNITLIRAVLGRAGFEVLSTVDPKEALRIAARERLDAAVLDLMMPEVSGLDVLKELRAQPATASLPILFLSSQAEAADRVRGLREGADDYLGKPFEPAELVLRLQRLLVSATAPAESLEGKLEDFPLAEVVQTLQQGHKGGLLAVVGAEGVGRVVLERGEIVAASFARLQGSDALQAMLDQERGRFRFTQLEVAGEGKTGASATLDLQGTLMEAAWIDDELALRRHLLPDLNMPLMVTEAPLPEPARNLPALPLHQIHHRIQTLPGVTLADLLSNQWAAPNRVRLGAAWLLENGALRLAGQPVPAEQGV